MHRRPRMLGATEGKALREIEELVSGHKLGDAPDAPVDVSLIRKPIRFEVSPATFAMIRETRALLADELGGEIDDDLLLATLCRRAFESEATCTTPTIGTTNPTDPMDTTDTTDTTAPTGTAATIDTPSDAQTETTRHRHATDRRHIPRPAHQISITTCTDCRRAWQDGAGRVIAIDEAALARASCDAELLDDVDGAAAMRRTSSVTARMRRQIFARDHHRCAVPGCRAARGLDIHHIVHQAEGGGHDASNLLLMCDLCRARHKGHYAGCVVMPGSGDPPTTMKAFCPA